MSLINEALKKAQRERDGGSTPAKQNVPTVGGAQPRRGNPADKTSFKLMQMLIAGALVLAVLGGAVGLLLTIMDKDPPPAAEPTTEVAVTIKPTEAQREAAQATSTAPPPATPAIRTPAAERIASATPQIATNPTPPAQSQPSPPPPVQPIPAKPAAPQTVVAAPPSAPVAPAKPTPAPTPVAAATPQAEPTARPTVSAPVTPPAQPTAPARPVAPEPISVASTPPTAPSRQPAAIPPPAASLPVSPPSPAPAQPTPAPKREPVFIPAPVVTIDLDGEKAPQPTLPAMPRQPVRAGNEAETAPVQPVANTEPNPKIIAFLEASRITGIKVAGSKSRVLMNNQVFKIGSIVEASSQLKITAIKANEIQFVDESGVEYRKQFQR